jgi:hypothetical protein
MSEDKTLQQENAEVLKVLGRLVHVITNDPRFTALMKHDAYKEARAMVVSDFLEKQPPTT